MHTPAVYHRGTMPNPAVQALVDSFEPHRARLMAEGKEGHRAVMTRDGLLGVFPTFPAAWAKVRGWPEGTFAIVEVEEHESEAVISHVLWN